MIPRKLSKAQGYAVQVLAVQLTQAQAAVGDAQEGINALAELYRAHFGLPEGESQFGQGPDGWTLSVKPAEKKTLAVPEPTPVEMLGGMTPAEARAALDKSYEPS